MSFSLNLQNFACEPCTRKFWVLEFLKRTQDILGFEKKDDIVTKIKTAALEDLYKKILPATSKYPGPLYKLNNEKQNIKMPTYASTHY